MEIFIKTLRLEKRLSQLETAKCAGITPQYYSLIERGKRRPSSDVAKKISNVLGFPDQWYKLLDTVK